MDRWEEEIGIKPTRYDSRGPLFTKEEVHNYVCKEINTTNTFQIRNTKVIKDNVKEVIEVIDDVTEIFNNSIDSLAEKQREIESQCKKVSSSVRDSANKLGDGLIRVEKMADFSKLERYVGLLERAATAFESLAELEKTGKLEKIALAIK